VGTRAGIDSHCSDAISSLHTSLIVLDVDPIPPHTTTDPGRLLRCTFTPSRAALLTPVSRHAPTGPTNMATRAQISGREVACSMRQLACVCVGRDAMIAWMCWWVLGTVVVTAVSG
jgi:hypothetical protein